MAVDSRSAPPDATPPRAILFDYDDTLVRTRECKFAALRALAERHYGHVLADDAIREHWGVPYRELFRCLFASVDADLERVIRRYEALGDEFPLDPHPETLEVLAALQTRLPIGIVTSAGRDIARRQLLAIGVDPASFAVFQTADDTLVHKPDPRVFDPALSRLASAGILPREVLYAGDSLRDLEAARCAGLQFYAVLRGTTSQAEFEAAGVAAHDDLRDLLATARSRDG